jgi:hypothetical protein
MEIDFDKEIDSILRSVAKGSHSAVRNPQSEHLDADEISAFAENVLPANARVLAIKHLADCNRCRRILVEISAFEAETPQEIIPIIETKTEIPWYKKLFVFPNLAYSLGGLFVLFAGIIGFVAFQNRNSVSSDVAVIEKPTYSKGASSDGQIAVIEVPSQNSNAVAANTTANSVVSPETTRQTVSNSAVAANAVPNLPQTSPTAPAVISQIPTKDLMKEKAKTNGEIGRSKANEALPTPKTEENDAVKSATGTTAENDKTVVQRKPESEAKLKNDASTADSLKGIEDEKQIVRSAPMTAPSVAKPTKKMSAQDESADSRQLSGKTFRRIGGTWFDSAYGKQPQTTVKRNTDDYKKLDDGLQNIGNSLGGNVVVLWKGKAYKIQ